MALTDLGSTQTTQFSNISVGGTDSSGSVFGSISAGSYSSAPTGRYSKISSSGSALVNELWVSSISHSGVQMGGVTQVGLTFSLASLIAPFVVQGSASSFTIVTWAAVAPGDSVECFPLIGGAVSSLSSGLVPTSYCTQAGQVEMRLSNVSTLVQNQSTRTWVFVATRSGITQ